ncbi:MAG: nucleotidyltransferase family protein [Sandaracinaceae bacterium]|nr:nucleotidyltransferase family protein [Sandaracinaceae bacterium]
MRNQARVHVWFEGKFGEPYPALASSAEALERFASPMFAVGVRLERDDALTVVAPFGLEDLFALRLRPNPRRPNRAFARVAASAAARWPELRIVHES